MSDGVEEREREDFIGRPVFLLIGPATYLVHDVLYTYEYVRTCVRIKYTLRTTVGERSNRVHKTTVVRVYNVYMYVHVYVCEYVLKRVW